MSGFQELKGAVDPSKILNPQITADQTAFSEEEMSDETALQLCLNDASNAIAYLQSKGLMPSGIDNADDLVRGYVKPRQWSDGKPRANMPMFQVLEAIEKILPVLHMSLFGNGQIRPFNISPRGKTKPDAARAKGTVLAWAIKQAGLKEEMRLMLKTCLTYGFCVGWWGWESKKLRKKLYVKQDDGTVKGKWAEDFINMPTFESLNLKNVLVDPKCQRQDIQKGAGYVIKQMMITANDLHQMAEDTETYKNIPGDEDLRRILSNLEEPTEDTMAVNKRAVWREFQAKLDSDKSTIDPLEQPLEYLEYWSEDRVIGVLQRKICIRNEFNEYRKIPGVSCAFIDVLASAWGFGVARLLSGEQRLQQGVVNNWIDSLALVLNPVYQLLKGLGPGTQNITVSPGKVITESGELKPLITPDVTGPAMEAVASSEERSNRRVKANSGTNLPTQALRTGTGVNALQGDVVQGLQYFLEIFIGMVYIPVLEAFLELTMDHLTPAQLNAILDDEEGKAWQGEILDIYNAQIQVECLAGTNLMAKAAAAQLMPQLFALVSSAGVQAQLETSGQKFNFMEATKRYCELNGLELKDLFQPMTQDDLQRVQQRNAALTRVQGDMALQDKKHQDTMSEIDATGFKEAGVGLIKQAAKTHMDVAQKELESMREGEGGSNIGGQ